MRALFSYDPANDHLLPCQDIGLSFNYGDVMEVIIHIICDPSTICKRITQSVLFSMRNCYTNFQIFNLIIDCKLG